MGKVIAVQETQMKSLREFYDKNISVNSVVQNVETPDINNLIDVSTTPQIDMESHVVNLNSQVDSNNDIVTNVDATNEVFTPIVPTTVNDDVVSIPTLEQSPEINQVNGNDNTINNLVTDVPYNEPTNIINIDGKENKEETENSYFELLNSLRNMVADFANNAYSAIDKFQEEKLQSNSSGIGLVENANVVEDNNSPATVLDPNNSAIPIDGVSNIFNTPSVDLDKTIVLPANFIAENIAAGNDGNLAA